MVTHTKKVPVRNLLVGTQFYLQACARPAARLCSWILWTSIKIPYRGTVSSMEGDSMSESTFIVKGMTCSGCMSKVSTAVTAVDGVTDVDVDISNGELTVISESPVSPEVIRNAVNEAGYEVAS